MRALYFLKIDYIKSRTQLYSCLGIGIVVIAIMQMSADTPGQVGFMYGVFIAIVFATTPFGACTRRDAGFQQLLPATTRQRVLGRFLFGFSLLLFGIGIGLVITALCYLMTGRREMVTLPICLITFAIGLAIITVQYIFFYLVGESKGGQFLSLVRMIPGMCFFFVSMKLMGEIQEDPRAAMTVIEKVGGNLDSIGWISAALSLAVMAAGIVVCVRATANKDY